MEPSIAEVWKWLNDIRDPEIPALSIVDLGIVRDVQQDGSHDELIITITPTYSGCPAMDAICSDIRSSMKEHGIERLRLRTELSPAWTTDWMTEGAKERLRQSGIAPPPSGLISIAGTSPHCPRCGSAETELISLYGSTACKALYKCRACLEPFDAFKRH